MSRLQPLPVDLVDHYNELVSESDVLRSLYVACLDTGIIDRHYGVVSVFLPKIANRLKHIRHLCRLIRRRYDNVGRPPKWYTAIEEIFMTAQELTHELRILKEKIKENRWLEIRVRVERYIRDCERIAGELESITLPDLQVYREEMKDSNLEL